MTQQIPPVLVGIDGTPSGLEALALGGAFAVLTGSPLILGAVYGYEVIAFDGGLVWPPKEKPERWLEQAQSRVGDCIPWSTRMIVSTSPERGLVTLAKAEGARMIVLGSSRRGAIGRVLPGSTGRDRRARRALRGGDRAARLASSSAGRAADLRRRVHGLRRSRATRSPSRPSWRPPGTRHCAF